MRDHAYKAKTPELSELSTVRMVAHVFGRSAGTGLIAGFVSGAGVGSVIFVVVGAMETWRDGAFPFWTALAGAFLGLVAGRVWELRSTDIRFLPYIAATVGFAAGMGYYSVGLLMIELFSAVAGGLVGFVLGGIEGALLSIVTARMAWRDMDQRAYQTRLTLVAAISAFVTVAAIASIPSVNRDPFTVNLDGIAVAAAVGGFFAVCAIPAGRHVAGWRVDPDFVRVASVTSDIRAHRLGQRPSGSG